MNATALRNEEKRLAMQRRIDAGEAPGVVGLGVNEHGTPLSIHVCTFCGDRFTVTPPAGPNWGTGCLDGLCPSYDIDRDVDYLLAAGCRIVRDDDV